MKTSVPLPPLLWATAWLVAACTPSYNWREVRLDAQVRSVLPCKPDTTSRPTELAGHRVTMEVLGCEAGAGMFVLTRVQFDDPAQTQAAAAHWKAAVLAHLRADADQELPGPIQQQALPWPPLRMKANGRRANGEPVQLEALWMARGAVLYHGAVYYAELPQDVVDMFFSSLAQP